MLHQDFAILFSIFQLCNWSTGNPWIEHTFHNMGNCLVLTVLCHGAFQQHEFPSVNLLPAICLVLLHFSHPEVWQELLSIILIRVWVKLIPL